MNIKTKIFNVFRIFFKIPFLEKVLRKFTNNRSPNSFISKLVPNHYQYKPFSWRKFTKNGITFEVDLNDYVGHYLYFFFDNSLHALLSMAKEGDYVFDIGANIGSTSLYLAQKIGDKGKVFSFEPDPYNYEQLKKNVNLNSFSNIEIFNIGLGNNSGTYKLFIDTPTNRGGNRILDEKMGSGKEFHYILVEKFDDWINNLKINRVDLIKIDVEGYEYNVLLGAENTLRKFKPKLFIELDDNNLKQQGHSASMLVLFLENMGYKIINSMNGKNISSADDFKDCHYDIICYNEHSL
jgi:FkbM family methyltransferase